jgi:hypothetical protein
LDGDRFREIDVVALPLTAFLYPKRLLRLKRNAMAKRCDVSEGPRYHLRTRKLTSEQELAIRAMAKTKSLRSLAAEYGVSHETIRTVLHTNEPIDVA